MWFYISRCISKIIYKIQKIHEIFTRIKLIQKYNGHYRIRTEDISWGHQGVASYDATRLHHVTSLPPLEQRAGGSKPTKREKFYTPRRLSGMHKTMADFLLIKSSSVVERLKATRRVRYMTFYLMLNWYLFLPKW